MPREKALQALAALMDVRDALLAPDGCPWDRKQTPESLCDYIVEEAFELAEAIRAGDAQEAREEMGDLLFLLLFVARLYEDAGAFGLALAAEGVSAKMVRRHPHVFADHSFADQEELMRTWEQIKRSEKANADGTPKGLFDSLPKGLPPLLKAYRINAKAARFGFTWESDADQEAQLAAEWKEFQEALAGDDTVAQEAEFGDYLFSLAEYGRRKGFKANAALDYANQKFLRRFKAMEALAAERGLSLDGMDLDAMNALWDEVKKG